MAATGEDTEPNLTPQNDQVTVAFRELITGNNHSGVSASRILASLGEAIQNQIDMIRRNASSACMTQRGFLPSTVELTLCHW